MLVKIEGLLEDLIRGEAIELSKPINYVVNKIIEEHYLRGTLIHKKLNFIINHLTNGGEGVPYELVQEFEDVFAVPSVPLSEIKASKFESKRGKYVKKHKRFKPKKEEEALPEKTDFVNVFDAKNIDLFLKKE